VALVWLARGGVTSMGVIPRRFLKTAFLRSALG
jgi:hypothetical protein